MKYLNFALLFTISHVLLAEDVIYSNTTNDQGTTLVFNANGLIAAGSAITFGGTSRFLTSAEFQIYNAALLNEIATPTLSLYNVVGNTLGSLIGAYGLTPASQTYLGSTVATLTFALPYVSVPNDIVWMLSFGNAFSNLGLNYFAGPPTVGSSSDTQAWWDTGSGPTLTPFPAGGESYYAVFGAEAATPEPSTWLMMSAGLAAVLVRRRAVASKQ